VFFGASVVTQNTLSFSRITRSLNISRESDYSLSILDKSLTRKRNLSKVATIDDSSKGSTTPLNSTSSILIIQSFLP
jgi:hypothetical protein